MVTSNKKCWMTAKMDIGRLQMAILTRTEQTIGPNNEDYYCV
jgi:hypothetical protein